jgi:hypothetical protein
VEIQYTRDEFKEDRSGHRRQCREAEERVVLAALAVWEDGSYEMLHYEIATEEGEANHRTLGIARSQSCTSLSTRSRNDVYILSI